MFRSLKTKHVEKFLNKYAPWLDFRRRLRIGGEALVCQCYDKNLETAVILRVAHIDLAETARLRFARSCRSLYHLQTTRKSKYFPMLLHLSLDPLFCVLDWTSGTTLRKYVDSPEYSVRKNVWIFSHLLNAVEDLHALGLVHRDVKPANVIVNSHVRLIDLGLAKEPEEDEDSALTNVEYALGSEEYSAEEQLENSVTVDFRADIPSLARIFFFLWTCVKEARKDEEWNPKLLPKGEIRNFFLRANNPDPEDRTPTVKQLRDEFFNLLHLWGVEQPLILEIPSPAQSCYTILDAYRDLHLELGGNRTRLRYYTGLTLEELALLHRSALEG